MAVAPALRKLEVSYLSDDDVDVWSNAVTQCVTLQHLSIHSYALSMSRLVQVIAIVNANPRITHFEFRDVMPSTCSEHPDIERMLAELFSNPHLTVLWFRIPECLRGVLWLAGLEHNRTLVELCLETAWAYPQNQHITHFVRDNPVLRELDLCNYTIDPRDRFDIEAEARKSTSLTLLSVPRMYQDACVWSSAEKRLRIYRGLRAQQILP